MNSSIEIFFHIQMYIFCVFELNFATNFDHDLIEFLLLIHNQY
jgi:hypothetical protein